MVFKNKKNNKEKKDNKNLEYSIDIYHVSKDFNKKTLKKGGYTTLKSLLLNPFKREKVRAHDVINAVSDLTIRIPKGRSVGIIGRNGAGKSTILKLISGIYKPTSGHINVNGRIAALIELGAGFHPDFTGRENIYLGGAMHGLTREEIDKVYDDIVSFAELEEFIDAPIRTYSSGMFMRLGFSLAIHTDPDILIVDEVLAVGDASFNAKCKDRLFEIKKQNKTLFLVSHDLNAVREWCDEVIWIEKGKVVDRGEPQRVIDAYISFINKKDSDNLKKENLQAIETAPSNVATQDGAQTPILEKRWGSREVEILGIKLEDEEGKETYVYNPESEMTIIIGFKLNEEVKDIEFGFSISRSDGVVIYGTNTNMDNQKIELMKNDGEVHIKINQLNILPAKYYIDVTTHTKDGYAYDYRKDVISFVVRSNKTETGLVKMEHTWEVL